MDDGRVSVDYGGLESLVERWVPKLLFVYFSYGLGKVKHACVRDGGVECKEEEEY